MRKLLIVSPHWSPVNAPDMQRIRLYLPYLREAGWEPTILAIHPDYIEGARLDPLMEKTYPADIRVIRTKGIPAKWTRPFGIGNLWLRCGALFRQTGNRLLEDEHFDLALFSTTQFSFFGLAPFWKRRFGLNYVLDYQDPWQNDYYKNTKTPPPGGRLRYWLSSFSAQKNEPKVLRDCSGVISVSPGYLPLIKRAYPAFDSQRFQVIPFGSSEVDFALARSHKPARPLIDFEDGHMHFVYTGRCGADMRASLNILFSAFRRFATATPSSARLFRFSFLGTDYAPAPLGREWVVPVARAYQLEQYIMEHPSRVPYFDALHYLTRAHAIIALGSDDPTYAASKIYPYFFSGRPLIGIYHQNSPSLALAERLNAGYRYAFQSAEDTPRLGAELARDCFEKPIASGYPNIDEDALQEISARRLAEGLCLFFDKLRLE